MYSITTEIDINASAEHVWQILMDFPAYEQWNPFIRSITGNASPGEALKVSVQPENSKAMNFNPKVLVADKNRELRWRGQLFLPGLFDGEHYFRIEPLPDNQVRFLHGEQFSGLLVGLAKSMLEGGTTSGFIAMNHALKATAESQV